MKYFIKRFSSDSDELRSLKRKRSRMILKTAMIPVVGATSGAILGAPGGITNEISNVSNKIQDRIDSTPGLGNKYGSSENVILSLASDPRGAKVLESIGRRGAKKGAVKGAVLGTVISIPLAAKSALDLSKTNKRIKEIEKKSNNSND